MEQIKEDEIVLYITKFAVAKAKRKSTLPSPVVAVYRGFNEEETTKRKRKGVHHFGSNSVALLIGSTSESSITRPFVRRLGYCGQSVRADIISELHSSKEKILKYLENREDLALHRKWISKLEQPHISNLPKGTLLSPNIYYI